MEPDQDRIAVVDHRDGGLEREKYTAIGTRYGNRNRCLPTGLGCIDGQYNDRGIVVRKPEITSHQSVEIERRYIYEGDEQHPCETEQHNYYCIHVPQPHGGTRSQSLAQCASQLWQWCLQRGITISADHLLGMKNVKADLESQTLHSSAEWMLPSTLSVDNTTNGTMLSGCLLHTSIVNCLTTSVGGWIPLQWPQMPFRCPGYI